MSLSRNMGGLFALIVSACLMGCTHNHYYTGLPAGRVVAPCDTPVMGQVVSTPVVAGNYCEIPAEGGQPVIVSSRPAASGSSTARATAPPRVVTSDPTYGTQRNGWRKRNNSVDASTRISGAIEKDDLVR